MSVPAELRYVDTHEWIRLDGDIAVIGITDHAQEALGDVVYFEAPQVGVHYTRGAACAVVESVKAASDIYAPVTGEVVEVNAQLVAQPDLINQDPYGQAWLFKIKLTQPSESDTLLTAAQYEAMIA